MVSEKRRLGQLRKLHGAMHGWIEYQKRQLPYVQLLKRKGLKESQELEKEKTNIIEDYPVDIVVTWVDGSDQVWLEEKNKFSKSLTQKSGAIDARFREWDTFRFLFRGIEKNAPWVRYVHLVTYGHLPTWLNIQNPKLKIVSHKDFIPERFLPTFSSHTIEANLWRIPELSEHFVYFNDDIYLMRKTDKSDFFRSGLPKYCAVARPIETFANMDAHRHARFNSIGIINEYFNINKCMEDYPSKWFSYKYKSDVKYNVRAYEDGYICGMHYFHQGIPFRKSAMEDFYNHFSETVDKTCFNRFRTSDDIMHQVVQMWEICHGTFEPIECDYYGEFVSPNSFNVDKVCDIIANSNCMMLCINDNEGVTDFERIRNAVYCALENRFPDKSSFEL